MLDLQKHKDFLWKYTLSYGKLEQRDGISVFPFCNILMEEGKTIEDYKSDDIKEKLYSAQNVSEIFDLISKEYQGYYFMEISTPLSEDKELYSSLLKKHLIHADTMDISLRKITNILSNLPVKT